METKNGFNNAEPNEIAAPAGMGATPGLAGTAPPEKRERDGSRLVSGWRFARHLLEMVVAMVAGMVALEMAVGALGEPPGYHNLLVEYALMGVSMSVSMVAWMRFRGHAWSDGLEMTAAMLAPMFMVVTPFALGAEGDTPGQSEHALMMLAHVAMVGGMVALMIHRRGRYT